MHILMKALILEYEQHKILNPSSLYTLNKEYFQNKLH